MSQPLEQQPTGALAGVDLIEWLTNKAEIFYREAAEQQYRNTMGRIEQIVGSHATKVIHLGIEARNQ